MSESGKAPGRGGSMEGEALYSDASSKTTSRRDGDEQAKVAEITKGVESLSVTGTAVEPSDVFSSLDPEAKAVVTDLKELQDKYKSHLQDYDRELSILKSKYEKLYKPLYKERAERLRQGGKPGDEIGTTALPNFWTKCFKNSSTLGEMVEECDEPILAYLLDISPEWLDQTQHSKGFKLIFEFAANPYFEPNVIVKQYNMSVPEGDSQPVLNSTESTKIEWKGGKNPTKQRIERKQRNKRTKQTRTVTEDVDRESFFNFFNSQELPNERELEEMPEQQVSDLELLIEADYEMGIMIRDKIIPQAVLWYLGEVLEDDEDFDEDFDDDEEGEEDDDDDSDEDEDEDSDEDVKARVKSKKGAAQTKSVRKSAGKGG